MSYSNQITLYPTIKYGMLTLITKNENQTKSVKIYTNLKNYEYILNKCLNDFAIQVEIINDYYLDELINKLSKYFEVVEKVEV